MEEQNQLQVILSEQDVSENQAKALLDAFGAPFEDAGEILRDYRKIVVTNESQKDLMKTARLKRLSLKNTRVQVENKRKELKADIVKTGRAIDSVAKFVKEIIEPAEKYLETQEKFAERLAAERRRQMIALRYATLQNYVDTPDLYKIEDISDDDFEKLIADLKKQKLEREEAARVAEETRKAAEEAERKERERIEAENAKLKAEAEAREAELAKQRAVEEKRLAAERAEQEKKLAEERAKAEEERKKREALEAEQRAKEAAEAKAKAEAEEKTRQALLAPDKEKLLAFATQIDEITLPALASKDAQAVLNNVEQLLQKVTTYIRGNVKGL